MILKRLLQKLGYHNVVVLDNGPDTLVHIENMAVDLVLMDVHIQGPYTGIETARRILHEQGRPIPIVFATAYFQELLDESLKALPHKGVINKPYSLDQLREAIEAALGHAQG
jgi:CheY-like chemotaxis protein